MNGDGWYLPGEQGQPHGPYATEQLARHLRSGLIPGTTLACRPGMAQWLPLGQIEAFAGVVPAMGSADVAAPVTGTAAAGAPVMATTANAAIEGSPGAAGHGGGRLATLWEATRTKAGVAAQLARLEATIGREKLSIAQHRRQIEAVALACGRQAAAAPADSIDPRVGAEHGSAAEAVRQMQAAGQQLQTAQTQFASLDRRLHAVQMNALGEQIKAIKAQVAQYERVAQQAAQSLGHRIIDAGSDDPRFKPFCDQVAAIQAMVAAHQTQCEAMAAQAAQLRAQLGGQGWSVVWIAGLALTAIAIVVALWIIGGALLGGKEADSPGDAGGSSPAASSTATPAWGTVGRSGPGSGSRSDRDAAPRGYPGTPSRAAPAADPPSPAHGVAAPRPRSPLQPSDMLTSQVPAPWTPPRRLTTIREGFEQGLPKPWTVGVLHPQLPHGKVGPTQEHARTGRYGLAIEQDPGQHATWAEYEWPSGFRGSISVWMMAVDRTEAMGRKPASGEGAHAAFKVMDAEGREMFIETGMSSAGVEVKSRAAGGGLNIDPRRPERNLPRGWHLYLIEVDEQGASASCDDRSLSSRHPSLTVARKVRLELGWSSGGLVVWDDFVAVPSR